MKVKICGVTHPEDAKHAARAGADYIGMIFSPNSKRRIERSVAKEIARAAKECGSEPVAVFVDETLDEIVATCMEVGIETVQLHGKARDLLPRLHPRYAIIYAISVSCDGSLLQMPELPEDVLPLFDRESGGTGQPFDWKAFSPPKAASWILAGGLRPDNVVSATRLLAPEMVDVASGVEKEGSVRKDRRLVEAFIRNAKRENSPSHRFGGQYLPEILMTPAHHLAQEWSRLRDCLAFKDELDGLLSHFAGRATPLTEVKNFARAIGGPSIFLKREDLLHTGAHKINNALGQCLLAKQMGKMRMIAETGAGQHGVATATACAHLGLECVVYMGAKDIERQKPNVEKMELLGAEVVPVNQGAATLKDAINEALRDWSANYESSHYCLGSALGPHPYPEMVRAFQSVISGELKEQIGKFTSAAPDLLIACIGGGSNAIGFFHHFIAG